MKLLVFAHTPPPHHGQSYMVELMLEALGGDCRKGGIGSGSGEEGVRCYHVDCRLSRDVGDIGQRSFGKIGRLILYCLEAIWCRFRYGVTVFYHVPASPMRSAVYRDWIIMLFCRPFFRRRVYHWHAVGLSEWLEKEARPWERWLTRVLLGKPDLSIILGEFNAPDAEKLGSKRIEVIPNGVPDPCSDFDGELLSWRRGRCWARRRVMGGGELSEEDRGRAGADVETFQVLYLSLCSREKGLMDLLEGVALAHERLRKFPVRIRLVVAGKFWPDSLRAEFDERIGRPDLVEGGESVVSFRGFVSGPDKEALMRGSDCFCFPTYYPAESFGLVLAEAMAFGLPIITTSWRIIPELMRGTGARIVRPRSPEEICQNLMELIEAEYDESMRSHFIKHFTDVRFGGSIRAAVSRVSG